MSDVDVDWLSREGAHELAARIRAYWTSRGADIKVWIEKVGQQHDGKAAVYGVRSDIGSPAR